QSVHGRGRIGGGIQVIPETLRNHIRRHGASHVPAHSIGDEDHLAEARMEPRHGVLVFFPQPFGAVGPGAYLRCACLWSDVVDSHRALLCALARRLIAPVSANTTGGTVTKNGIMIKNVDLN